MDIRVLRPRTRIFCFFPRRVEALDDSGASEGGAQARGEVGAVAEGLIAAALVDGGRGTARLRMT
jgi:hypothetical protein